MATRDYTLGKGKVLFKPENSQGYIDLGNAPAFAINATIDKLEHFSSREGLSTKDLEVITKLGMGGSFTLDEPNSENLRMFVMSTAAAAAAQNSGSTVADAISNVVLDRWYPLQITAAGSKAAGTVTASAYNQGTMAVPTVTGTQVADLTVTYDVQVVEAGIGTEEIRYRTYSGGSWSAWSAGTAVVAATPEALGATGVNVTFANFTNIADGDVYSFTVTYTAGGATRITNITALTHATHTVADGDFILDAEAGLVMFPSTGDVGAGNTVTWATTTYAANATKTATDGGTLTSLRGELYFVGNPPVGRVLDIQGFCSLTPNGDFSLIGEDWMQMQFNVEFLAVEGIAGLIHVTDRGKK